MIACIHTEEGSYWAEVPELLGCFASGDALMSCSSPCKRASCSIWPMKGSRRTAVRRDGNADGSPAYRPHRRRQKIVCNGVSAGWAGPPGWPEAPQFVLRLAFALPPRLRFLAFCGLPAESLAFFTAADASPLFGGLTFLMPPIDG